VAADDVQGEPGVEQSAHIGRGRAVYFHEKSTFCVFLRNRLRTICSAERTIHFDYQHPRDKVNNERRIARASRAEWLEVVVLR
jgi:hypothetical protein